MNNKLSIPTEFTLGGSTITVEVLDNRMETGNPAWYDSPTGRIRISSTSCGLECSNDYIESSLYHEVVHAIFRTMGKLELNKDEEFVEGFANLLHQYNKTVKYHDNEQTKVKDPIRE